MIKRLAVALSLQLAFGAAPGTARALIAPADAPVRAEAKADRALESKKVVQRLKALGFDETEISSKLSQLSDAEVHQLAVQSESLQPGGHGEGVLITIGAVAVIILLVVYLLQRV